MKLDIQIFLTKDLYSGDKAYLAPEIFISVDGFQCSVSTNLKGLIYTRHNFNPMKNGTHRMKGILIASGPKIIKGKVEGAQLQDVAPTILHLADLPIPASIDGRILLDLFHPKFRTPKESGIRSKDLQPENNGNLEVEEDEDTTVFLQRLRDLGYLE
jgi:predicted AlkP superfamily phosphohydrolase/phosphomutase